MSSMSAAGEGEGEANDDNWEERESSFAPPPPENPLKKFEDFKARLNKASVNDFVTARFVMVKKGMMGGKVSNETLISWAAKPPKQPLLKGTPTDKKMVAAVADIFAATCSFMSSEEPNHKLMTDIAAKTGQNTDPSVVVALKSELLVFIVKQTNGNPSEEARVRGFELMAQVLRSSRVLPDDGMLLDVLRKITLKKRSEQSAVGGLCCVAFHALLLPEDKRRELGELSREQVEVRGGGRAKQQLVRASERSSMRASEVACERSSMRANEGACERSSVRASEAACERAKQHASEAACERSSMRAKQHASEVACGRSSSMRAKRAQKKEVVGAPRVTRSPPPPSAARDSARFCHRTSTTSERGGGAFD
jgi:hypothetical protein